MMLDQYGAKQKVSVIIPCFNSECWLAEAIDSVLRQKILNLEIVVVNDGSSDGTQKIAESYGDKVVLINQVNSGVSWARREGVRHATGDYIKFLDSDDMLPEAALQDLLDVAIQFPNEVVIGNAITIVSNGCALDEIMYSLAYKPNHLDLLPKEFLLTQATQSGLWLLPKHVVNQDCFFNHGIQLGEEYAFCIELIRAGAPIRFCDRIVCQIRAHNETNRLSQTKNETRHLKQVALIADSIACIESEVGACSSVALDIIARKCWSRGRDCIRIDCKEAAEAYFILAKKVRPDLRPVGSYAYRMLSQVFGPFTAETVIQRIKCMLSKPKAI